MNTMNMKRRMKMRRGLMCQSPGATAVCMTGDSGSVIVPRRPDQTLVDRASFTGTSNNTKYTRLVDQSPQRFGTIISTSTNSSAKMIRSSSSIPMPHLKRSDQNASVTDRKALQKPASIPMPPLKRSDENASVKDRETLQKPAASSADQQLFQVVVMRVSLHCQGCAGKVKKHISKMEGVTSFSIDLESKRVTVMGHVSPVGVLESISKVKRAEFWPF